MHSITVKYVGTCQRCGASLPTGSDAMYEKHVGYFCPGCAPTDPEEVRGYRQRAADGQADQYERWAAAHRASAEATLAHTSHYTEDTAFNTQPGNFPLRRRIIAQENKAFEELATAERMEHKAERLRHVRVAGDAEAERQAQRLAVLGWLRVGQVVQTAMYGFCEVVKINRKTASVLLSGWERVSVDLSFLRQVQV